MDYKENILHTIGDTPLVRLNRITKDLKGLVLAKVETFNPGNSVKDRMAVQMIEDAEEAGLIKPGGTIVEGTSGNTGMGLAIACIMKGYKLICTTTDKQSKEKVDMLKAMGAEVVVCPTNVEPEDPRSYYSMARSIAEETDNAYYINQYDNPGNAKAHYLTTGPEIWKQTDGKVTHFIVGVGTGGTISGVGKYLKEQNPDVKIIGIDTYGSVFKKYHETGVFDEKEIYPYITEGIGEDILPKNVDFEIIDHFEKVTDKDAAVMTRRLAREEGIFVGNSAGAALAGLRQVSHMFDADSVVVVLFHDHGSRYVGKIFNDDWMRERGFLDKEMTRAGDLLKAGRPALITLEADEPVVKAVDLMRKHNISQIPVVEDGKIIGTITESSLFNGLLEDTDLRLQKARSAMGPALPVLERSRSIEDVAKMLTNGTQAVLVDMDGKLGILTKQDIISCLG